MAISQNTIAVIFDFDDTLTDDSTSQLLKWGGIDIANFWSNQAGKLVKQGWDPTLAYLHLIIQNVGQGKPLGELTNGDLKKFGETLKFYPGLPGIFADLRKIVKEHDISNPSIEFYVISGGLEEIIRGSKIASHLTGSWGCEFATDENDIVQYPKRIITFTEKTRYIFQINKGISHKKNSGPYAVNEKMDEDKRRIPLSNMIYLGDGLTDVPCFSLIQRAGGKAFGVFDPSKEGSPKKAWEKLVTPHRVATLNSPKYRKSDDLGALLRAAVSQMCVAFDLRTQEALP